MKIRQPLPLLLSALCLCACDRPASPKLYNPGTEPLTADELAWLLRVYHWKITQTPNDGKPYWGVRLVVANRGSTLIPLDPPPAPYKTLRSLGQMQFDSPVASNGNPRILIGLRLENGNVTGSLTVTHPDTSTDTTWIHMDHVCPTDGGINACSGSVWKDNRVDLIDFRDGDFKPVGAICLEFLHSQP